MKKILLLLLLILITVPVIILGLMGFVPVLSSILGTDKPRDLGIKFTPEDLRSIRTKSQVQYLTLPESDNPSKSLQFSGQREVAADFSSEEITATVNNQPWKYFPYQNIQVKFNADGSGEISGSIIKNKFPSYARAFGIPSEAVDFAMKFLPSNPAFYLKGKAALTDNKISVFEPQNFQIGLIPMPIPLFLSMGGTNLISQVYAQNINEMADDLSKVQNKRSLIIGFINSRLSSSFGSFYAKKAYFGDNKLIFDGTLTEKISYTP